MEYKALGFTAGALQAGGNNTTVVNWSGVNSAPVGAWNKEVPLNKWDDILMLLERLAPDKPLIPQEQGSNYLIGDTVTAVDFYWAAFSNLVAIQSPAECPLDPKIRSMFERVTPTVAAAVDPILIEHRDRIMHNCFKVPMEL